jgi:hypothetical protein
VILTSDSDKLGGVEKLTQRLTKSCFLKFSQLMSD